MAQAASMSKVIVAVFVAFVLSIAAAGGSAQQDGAIAPSPSMDTGAAFSLPVSGVAVAFSLIVSLFAFLKH